MKFLTQVYEEIKQTGKERYLTIAEKEALKATLFQKFGLETQEKNQKEIGGDAR